jgi:drug/metabolite transporter (DMT)-like permease
LSALHRDNLRGSLLMVAAMVCFAFEDVLIKQLSGAWPMGQVLVLVGLGGGAVFSLIARMYRKPILFHALLTRPLLLRNLCEAAGSTAFVAALVLGTLSGASAILQAAPLVVTLGAALFLGESVGWRRWSAIAIGLLGVLLIIQPGLSGFSPASLLALLAVLLLSARDLASRAVPPEVSSVQLAAWGFLALVPGGLLTMLLMGMAPVLPAAADAARLAAVLAIGCVGYYAMVAATRLGEISAVIPFRYTRLVFALFLAHWLFGERPNALMLTGSALVVATGLFTIWRSAARRRQQLRE